MKRIVRQAPDVLVVHNPPPTPEMAEFAVKQEFKKEVDINELVSRAQRGIQPPAWMTANTPRYGDFSDMPASFQEAFQIVQDANTAFMALPIEMRKELDHDPRNLDHADKDMYRKYGLLSKAAMDAEFAAANPPDVVAPTTEGRQQKSKASPDAQKSSKDDKKD